MKVYTKKETYICAKNVILIVHELGTIANNRSTKHEKNEKKILGKLYARKFKINNIIRILINELGTFLCICKLNRNNLMI